MSSIDDRARELRAQRVAFVHDRVVLAERPTGAMAALGAALGYEIVRGGDIPDGATAVVVASHGRAEETPLVAALQRGVEYVGLVASRVRGAAVVAALPVEDALRARVVTPAGLDIGARTPEEVALSILADIIAHRPRPRARAVSEGLSSAAAALDPVCGMAVAAVDASLHLDHDGTRYHFCGTGCLRAFAAEPDRYA